MVTHAMFERFTEKAIKVVMLAQEEARRLGERRAALSCQAHRARKRHRLSNVPAAHAALRKHRFVNARVDLPARPPPLPSCLPGQGLAVM